MSADLSAVGCVGVLIVATRGADGPGEVLLRIRGGTEAYLAWSDEPMPKGASVLVTESLGNRAVGIVPWLESDPF